MFSMCSELTPRAHVPDNRIPQLMQPCLEHNFQPTWNTIFNQPEAQFPTNLKHNFQPTSNTIFNQPQTQLSTSLNTLFYQPKTQFCTNLKHNFLLTWNTSFSTNLKHMPMENLWRAQTIVDGLTTISTIRRHKTDEHEFIECSTL